MKKSNLFKKVLFGLALLISQNLFGQLSLLQDKDSCILLDGNFKLTSSLCNCNSLKNDTLLLIKTILNAAKDRWGSTLLYGYPYKPEDSDVYPCSSTDCRNVGKCADQRNQLFCAHFFVYDVLFRQRTNGFYQIYINSGKNRTLHNYYFKYCEHPNKRVARKIRYPKNSHPNPNDPRLKDVKKIKNLYKKWLIKIEQVGLEEARKQKIYPFNNTKYNWSMDPE